MSQYQTGGAAIHILKQSGRTSPTEAEFWDGHALRSKTYLSVPTGQSLSIPFLRLADACFLGELGAVKSKVILDVGSGLGELSLVLSQMGGSVVGLDISPIMVTRSRERSRHNHIPATFMLGDAQNLPFADASLDLVVGMRSIHHFPDLTKFFKEVHRTLKPGGRAVFIEPQKKNPIVEFNRKVLNPEMHTKGEHPLHMLDINGAVELFDDAVVRTFCLFSPLSFVFKFILPWDSVHKVSYMILQKVDSVFERRQMLQSYCWQVLLVLNKD